MIGARPTQPGSPKAEPDSQKRLRPLALKHGREPRYRWPRPETRLHTEWAACAEGSAGEASLLAKPTFSIRTVCNLDHRQVTLSDGHTL